MALGSMPTRFRRPGQQHTVVCELAARLCQYAQPAVFVHTHTHSERSIEQRASDRAIDTIAMFAHICAAHPFFSCCNCCCCSFAVLQCLRFRFACVRACVRSASIDRRAPADRTYDRTPDVSAWSLLACARHFSCWPAVGLPALCGSDRGHRSRVPPPVRSILPKPANPPTQHGPNDRFITASRRIQSRSGSSPASFVPCSFQRRAQSSFWALVACRLANASIDRSIGRVFGGVSVSWPVADRLAIDRGVMASTR